MSTYQNKVTIVGVQFKGTAPKKRKVEFQLERIERIEHHIELDGFQIAYYSRKAKEIIKDKGYKNVSGVQLTANYGYEQGNLEQIEIFPKQRINIQLV